MRPRDVKDDMAWFIGSGDEAQQTLLTNFKVIDIRIPSSCSRENQIGDMVTNVHAHFVDRLNDTSFARALYHI